MIKHLLLLSLFGISCLQAGITDFLSYPGLNLYKKGYNKCYGDMEPTQEAASQFINNNAVSCHMLKPDESAAQVYKPVLNSGCTSSWVAVETISLNGDQQDMQKAVELLTCVRHYPAHIKLGAKVKRIPFVGSYLPGSKHVGPYYPKHTQSQEVRIPLPEGAEVWVNGSNICIGTQDKKAFTDNNENKIYFGKVMPILTKENKEAVCNIAYQNSYARFVKNSLLLTGLVGAGIYEAKKGRATSFLANNISYIPSMLRIFPTLLGLLSKK